jgi:hypothetical protein
MGAGCSTGGTPPLGSGATRRTGFVLGALSTSHSARHAPISPAPPKAAGRRPSPIPEDDNAKPPERAACMTLNSLGSSLIPSRRNSHVATEIRADVDCTGSSTGSSESNTRHPRNDTPSGSTGSPVRLLRDVRNEQLLAHLLGNFTEGETNPLAIGSNYYDSSGIYSCTCSSSDRAMSGERELGMSGGSSRRGSAGGVDHLFEMGRSRGGGAAPSRTHGGAGGAAASGSQVERAQQYNLTRRRTL